MEQNIHIASLIVLARPELFDGVKANLRLLQGVELHQESPEGKLVVVLEMPGESPLIRHAVSRRQGWHPCRGFFQDGAEKRCCHVGEYPVG